jgi:hypothetical protein
MIDVNQEIDMNQEREAAIDQLTTAKNTVWGIVAILAHEIDATFATLGDLLRWRDAAIEQRDRKRAAELALLIRQHAGLMAYWQVFGHAHGF